MIGPTFPRASCALRLYLRRRRTLAKLASLTKGLLSRAPTPVGEALGAQSARKGSTNPTGSSALACWRFFRVQLDQFTQFLASGCIELRERLWSEKAGVVPGVRNKSAIFVEDPGQAPRHTGAEVEPSRTEHHHQASGHVFAAVVAHAFHDRQRSGIAHGEALARRGRQQRADPLVAP